MGNPIEDVKKGLSALTGDVRKYFEDAVGVGKDAIEKLSKAAPKTQPGIKGAVGQVETSIVGGADFARESIEKLLADQVEIFKNFLPGVLKEPADQVQAKAKAHADELTAKIKQITEDALGKVNDAVGLKPDLSVLGPELTEPTLDGKRYDYGYPVNINVITQPLPAFVKQ